MRSRSDEQTSGAEANIRVRIRASHLSPPRGERSDCEAIRVRGRCRDSEPGGNAPSPRPSPCTRGEGGAASQLQFPIPLMLAERRTHVSRAHKMPAAAAAVTALTAAHGRAGGGRP
jgi:hypothetical protein